MQIDMVPALAISGFFVYLVLKTYFHYKLHMSALDKGQPLPESPRNRGDLRKPALVLIALGLGYAISIYTTLSLVPDADAPALAVSIWGIVPILIGAGLWIYWRMKEKERAESERVPSSLT